MASGPVTGFTSLGGHCFSWRLAGGGTGSKVFHKIGLATGAGSTSRHARETRASGHLDCTSGVSAAVKPAFMSESREKHCQVLRGRDRIAGDETAELGSVINQSNPVAGHRCPGGRCQSWNPPEWGGRRLPCFKSNTFWGKGRARRYLFRTIITFILQLISFWGT